MKYITLLLTLCAASVVNAMEVPSYAVQAPARLGDVAVIYSKQGFAIRDENGVHEVKSHWLDRELREMNPERLAAFSRNGYFRIKKSDDGQYGLSAHVRGEGGGPVAGWCAWGATHAIMNPGTWIPIFRTNPRIENVPSTPNTPQTGANGGSGYAALVNVTAMSMYRVFANIPWLP